MDELLGWLGEIEREHDAANELIGDEGREAMWRWGVNHGPALIAKVEELAGALARIETRIYQAQLQFERRWGEAKRSEAFRLTNEARKIVENALRAPGGATGKHPVVEGNRGSIAQKHDNEAVSPSRESRRAPGGGER